MELFCGTIEDLVGANDPLRKVEAHVDSSFIYEEVRELYCTNNGRPSIDPVVLVKYLLVGYLEGIRSEREIKRQIRNNAAYRWFLELILQGCVPDHPTISQNRRRRFNGTGLFRNLFEDILRQCIKKGLVDGTVILHKLKCMTRRGQEAEEDRCLLSATAFNLKRMARYLGQSRGAVFLP